MAKIINRLTRAAALIMVVAALLVAATSQAGAQNNDRGTAGRNQGRNCVAQGGHATVYIEEQGDGTSVSYVWCEFSDGSGWSCSNTDYGTGCFTWRSAPTDPRGPKGSRTDLVTADVAPTELVAEPERRSVSRGETFAPDATSGMAPLEDEG